MKVYVNSNLLSLVDYYEGTAQEVSSLFSELTQNEGYYCYHGYKPAFNPSRTYSLEVNRELKTVEVISGEVFGLMKHQGEVITLPPYSREDILWEK